MFCDPHYSLGGLESLCLLGLNPWNQIFFIESTDFFALLEGIIKTGQTLKFSQYSSVKFFNTFESFISNGFLMIS